MICRRLKVLVQPAVVFCQRDVLGQLGLGLPTAQDAEKEGWFGSKHVTIDLGSFHATLGEAESAGVAKLNPCHVVTKTQSTPLRKG